MYKGGNKRIGSVPTTGFLHSTVDLTSKRDMYSHLILRDPLKEPEPNYLEGRGKLNIMKDYDGRTIWSIDRFPLMAKRLPEKGFTASKSRSTQTQKLVTTHSEEKTTDSIKIHLKTHFEKPGAVQVESLNKLATGPHVFYQSSCGSVVCALEDKVSDAVFFEPAKLVEYVKGLACFPRYEESDKLVFVSIRAQLLAFKQCTSLLNFPTFLKDMTDAKTEEETLSECVADKRFGRSSSVGKKRKVACLESSKPEKKMKNNEQKVAEPPCFVMRGITLRMESKTMTPTLNPLGDSNSISKVEVVNKKMKKPELEELASKESFPPDEMNSNRKGTPQPLHLEHSNCEDFEKFIEETSCSNLNHDREKASVPSDVKESSDQQNIFPEHKDNPEDQTDLKDCSAESSGAAQVESFNKLDTGASVDVIAEQNIPGREEHDRQEAQKRGARKRVTLDEETLIPGRLYHSWIQDASDILRSDKKRMKLPPTQLFEEHVDETTPRHYLCCSHYSRAKRLRDTLAGKGLMSGTLASAANSNRQAAGAEDSSLPEKGFTEPYDSGDHHSGGSGSGSLTKPGIHTLQENMKFPTACCD